MNYQLPVGELMSQPVGTIMEHLLPVNEELALSEGVFVAGQNLPIELIHVPDGVAVIIPDTEVQVSSQCYRCLKPTMLTVPTKTIEEIYYLHEQSEFDFPTQDYARIDTKHMRIDLEPFIQEALELNLPGVALCNQDCPGLAKQTDSAPIPHHNPFRDLT